MKSYLIHFIRNGATAADTEGQYIGHTDVPLSEAGRQQLQQQRETQMYPAVDAVFASPLMRCVETATILYPQNKPLGIDGFMEYNFGSFEGKTAQELEEHPVFARWLAGEPDAAPPFGESTQAFSLRVADTFIKVTEGLMKTGTTRAAIVTHGGVIMGLLAMFGLPELPMHEWRMPNGCGFTVRVTPSVWARGKKVEVISEFPYELEPAE